MLKLHLQREIHAIMPLFENLEVDRDVVEALVMGRWGFSLGDQLKASQNRTYAASNAEGKKFAVRVASSRHHERIRDEMAFVNELASCGTLEGVCEPIHPLAAAEGEFVITSGDISVIATRWAEGSMMDFMSYRWMTDREIILAWGAWMAKLHSASREFSRRHPDIAARVRRYDQVHEGIMAGTHIHPDDVAVMTDPEHYGILHGDLNVSNFHIIDKKSESGEATPALQVFDWDQIQLGWFEYDMAQSMLTCLMLAEGGSLPAGDPVSEAKPDVFQAHFVEGYESVGGAGAVNLPRLARMLAMRKEFYAKFCRQAVVEGSPPDMTWFIEYVVRWVNRS
jgi:Ser/Thr protein kinase RdoA (MazF antagonist)